MYWALLKWPFTMPLTVYRHGGKRSVGAFGALLVSRVLFAREYFVHVYVHVLNVNWKWAIPERTEVEIGSHESSTIKLTPTMTIDLGCMLRKYNVGIIKKWSYKVGYCIRKRVHNADHETSWLANPL
jgi:hypothetical protein